jgi:hypothetical protein
MCKKLMFLISFVLLLGLVSSASAATVTWTDAYPWSNLWISGLNWSTGMVPTSADTVRINPELCSPAWLGPVIDANANAANIEGPRFTSDIDQVMYVLAGVVNIGGYWRFGDSGSGKSTIEISGTSKVTMGGRFRLKSGSADITIADTAYVKCDRLENFDGATRTVLNINDGATLQCTGGPSFGPSAAGGELTINIAPGASMLTGGNTQLGNDIPGHVILNLAGVLNCGSGRLTTKSPIDAVLSGNAYVKAGRTRLDMGGSLICQDNSFLEVVGGDFGMSDEATDSFTSVIIKDNARVTQSGGNIRMGDAGGGTILVQDNGQLSGGGNINIPDTSKSPPGTGVLTLTGNAAVTATGTFKLPGGNGTGTCYLYGGQITCGNFAHDSTKWSMDIEAGVLVITGDKVAEIQGNVDDGHITAYHGRGDVHIDFNNVNVGKTTVWATPNFMRAWNPSPLNNATGVASHGTCLSWNTGDYAIAHHLWFSDDQACVTSRNLACYIGELGVTSYCLPPLDLCKTYYWVVDEEALGHVITEGLVWKFTVECSYAVENFEEYTLNPHYIFDVWMDGCGDVNGVGGNGTGSCIDLAMNYVHSGTKSMIYVYDNTGDHRDSNYSEATRSFSTAQDWTSSDAAALVLWFRGNSGNASSAMWVLLNGNVGAIATYGDNGDDPEDIKKAEWIDWNISLADFGDVGSITSISIGFGDKIGDVPGGEGSVNFDDIALYPVRCVPKYTPALQGADYDGNCVVDGKDLKTFCAGWLTDLR